MFGFGSSGSGNALDPEKERAPPPLPTPVSFPKVSIPGPRPSEEFAKRPPNLFRKFCMIQKPTDIQVADIAALNLEIHIDTELDDLIPAHDDGMLYVPPKSWLATNEASRQSSITHEIFSAQKHVLLSNNHKSPDRDAFFNLAKEVTCESEDGFRVIGRRKARPGHPAPKFSHFRKFWVHLDNMSHYWDTSLDNYTAVDGIRLSSPAKPAQPAPQPPPPPPTKGLKRLSLSISSKPAPVEAVKSTAGGYTGRRASTGSKMPENYRIDAVRGFLEPIIWAFGCQLMNPRKVPHLEIKGLLIPVTQSAIIWRTPIDKALIKKAIVEGPLFGIQCRAETAFTGQNPTAIVDVAREISGLLLMAEFRARENKEKEIPGLGKWWTTVPRWGGGPGGEFGEAEGNKDAKVVPLPGGRRGSTAPASQVQTISLGPKKRTEEEVWRELKPAAGEWDSRVVYVAVGKEVDVIYDNVYMISSIFHHISILRMEIHPLYTEFLVTGQKPAGYPAELWSTPKFYRSRWYDMLKPEDRGELLRGIWGIMAYQMRGGAATRPHSSRQHSDAAAGLNFRKKSSPQAPTTSKLSSFRSHSVAF